MRLALIGNSGHVNYYAPVLQDIPQLEIVAVSLSMPDEKMEHFDDAPGVSAGTRRYTDYREMLKKESPGMVQVCALAGQITPIVELCLQRGIAVMAEKPLASDLQTLERLFAVAKKTGTPLAPLFGYRRMDCFAAVTDMVRKGGIGEPFSAYSQLSYKWGRSRADLFRSRKTFPGIVPFIGIHALDWLLWMMGDVFVSVKGWESATAHPDFPACASQSAMLMQMRNGGVAAVMLDFLRPESAPTHGDERVRIAGTRGVIESQTLNGHVTLINDSGVRDLPVPHVDNWYTTFVRSLQSKKGSFITLEQTFRVTEVAIKAQQAVDQGTVISLTGSPYAAS